MVIWNDILQNDWQLDIVLSSVPLWKYDHDLVPVANASGCLVDYAGARFLLSIAHASIARDEWHFEVQTLKIFEDGRAGTWIQPVTMNFLTEFRLIEETNEVTLPKVVDFTYRKITPQIGSQQNIIFANGAMWTGERKIFQPDFNIKPDHKKKYGFFGQVRFSGVKGTRILFDHQLEDNLTYEGKDGNEFIFKLPHPYGSHKNYQGCSGAPIIDEDGNLIALVSYGLKSTNCIYGIDINRYRAALEIEAGPPLPLPPKQ